MLESRFEKRLDKLAAYYAHFNVSNWDITFEQFVHFVNCGRMLEFMESDGMPLVYKGRLADLDELAI